MENIALKGLSRAVSRLCMGGCPMGEYGWGRVSREEVLRAMRGALDDGVTFFDTADTYGLGRSEETLGEALAGRREEAVIATKFGVRVEGGRTFYDNSPAYIRAALDASLRRLRTDRVDLYQIHYLDGRTPARDVMETLLALRREGKLRAIGLSNVTAAQAEEFRPWADDIASFQNQFSLAHRDGEAEIRRIAACLSAAPLTWGSLGQGVLTGKYGADAAFGADDRRSRAIYDNFHGEKLQKNLAIVEVLRGVAASHGVTPAAAAIRYILDALPGSVVITGVKSPDQAAQNAAALRFTLSQEEIDALTAVSA